MVFYNVNVSRISMSTSFPFFIIRHSDNHQPDIQIKMKVLPLRRMIMDGFMSGEKRFPRPMCIHRSLYFCRPISAA